MIWLENKNWYKNPWAYRSFASKMVFHMNLVLMMALLPEVCRLKKMEMSFTSRNLQMEVLLFTREIALLFLRYQALEKEFLMLLLKRDL